MSGGRAAAGVLFLDEDDQVLMVVPSYKDTLEIPGGGVEPGESPYAAARREVQEELGIAPPIGRLLVADWWSDSPDGVGGPKLLFVFAPRTLIWQPATVGIPRHVQRRRDAVPDAQRLTRSRGWGGLGLFVGGL